MSKKRDRQRVRQLRERYPDYRGFRGYQAEPTRPEVERGQLTPVVCTVCGRRRNVPLGVAQAEGQRYVCLSCREEQAARGGP